MGFWAWVLRESPSSQGTLGFLRSKRGWAAGFPRVLRSPPLGRARPGTGVPKHWGLEGVRALEPRVLVRQSLSSGKTQPGISENPKASSRGRIRVSAEKPGELARGGALKEDARGSDYLSGAGPWVVGAGPGGPGAPGGSHNADIPEPEAGAAQRKQRMRTDGKPERKRRRGCSRKPIRRRPRPSYLGSARDKVQEQD